MTKLFTIQANGTVFNQVENPAAVFSKDSGTLHKIGERDDMESYFNVTQAAYRGAGFNEMADDIVLMDLPRDQDEIDKVFGITGYVKTLYTNIANG